MKRRHLVFSLLIMVLMLTAPGTVSSTRDTAQDTETLWREVDRADAAGLPRTAIDTLKKIDLISRRDGRYDEALRALVRQIVLESIIAGNKPAEKVNRLREELAAAPREMKPLMRVVLAHWQWHYYQRNRWRFLNRSRTAQLDDADFTTWDLPRLFSEISTQYRACLEQETLLRRIPVSRWYRFLEKGSLPEALRPTLFDFVAFEAIGFFTTAEQAGAAPQDMFLIRADGPALAPADAFMRHRFDHPDEESAHFQALKIFQRVLRHAVETGNRDAWLDADIERLRFVASVAVGDGAVSRALERLREITTLYSLSPLASQARYHRARLLREEGRLKEAHAEAGAGRSAHPDSRGGRNCLALMKEIESKEFRLKTEKVIHPTRSGHLVLSYKNLSRIHLRILRDDLDRRMKGQGRIAWISADEARDMLSAHPLHAWSLDLAPTPDFKERRVRIDLPVLPHGFYRVFASARDDFSFDGNHLESSPIWVSSLGLILRGGRMPLHGFVVQGMTGRPLAGAAVELYRYDYNDRRFKFLESAFSGADGGFGFAAAANSGGNRLLVVRAEGRGTLVDEQPPRFWHGETKRFTRTVFFTDRALYRPGQSIHFKGICLSVDRESDRYEVLKGQRVTVRLRDPNRQEVDRLVLVSNDFGSISGTFSAPRDRLLGAMSLVADTPDGSTTIRVEEYKRPKFRLSLSPPKGEVRLGETVTVRGEARAFTGAAIDGADVTFRVVRRVNLPNWWTYWYGSTPRTQKEIAHGSVQTDENGAFAITFTAGPDETLDPESQPVFFFNVSVDVTDAAGETRGSALDVRLGYAALEARVRAREWQMTDEPVGLDITTRDLNGGPLSVAGRVEVFRLAGPQKPVPVDLIGELSLTESQGNDGGWTTRHTPDWQRWPNADRIAVRRFRTEAAGGGNDRLEFRLKPGAYRAELHTQDASGRPVRAFAHLLVLAPGAKRFDPPLPLFFASPVTAVEVGETFEAVWGTGYARGPVLVEVLQGNRALKRTWVSDRTQGRLAVTATPALRGGFTVRTTLVKENRLYQFTRRIAVPWSNKALHVGWETFRSTLKPGQEETWRLKIKGPGAALTAAEMVATLFDASLDAFQRHAFPGFHGLFRFDDTFFREQYSNAGLAFTRHIDRLNPFVGYAGDTHTRFPDEVNRNLFGYGYGVRHKARSGAAPAAAPPVEREEGLAEPRTAVKSMLAAEVADAAAVDEKHVAQGEIPTTQPDLERVQARRNLAETAFFYPHLRADADGTVRIEFTMPEALTEWRFIGFAHGRDLSSGLSENRVVTRKELMVQPNAPRFLREGDRLEFTVKVSNMAETAQTGRLRLTFFDPRDDGSLNGDLAHAEAVREFAIPQGQSRSFSFPITVSDGLDLVGYRAVAVGERFSDGEEGVLPVLSRRILVKESLPLWISGAGSKLFEFKKLLASAASSTLDHRSLVVQMASNPAWYAIQALPFLMEFPYECSEQVFNRLYANALARKIAASDPRIRKIFDRWKGSDALASNLEKNDHLKSILLQESPWVLQAKDETRAKQRVGWLFDENLVNRELKRAYDKLAVMQLADGSWPWFPGGPGNSYITLYIMTGFGRLAHLGVDGLPREAALKAVGFADRWIAEVHAEIVRRGKQHLNHLSPTIALYLYGRSFYLKDRTLPEPTRTAVTYFLDQADTFWLQLSHRQSQGHLALALHRFGRGDTARTIMRSIEERSQVDEEMGRFWGELEFSWWWYRAPIETQAVMIEAFDEVTGNRRAVEECKVWLLKQKQTQDWKTTKATADAVYALILRGEDLLASDALVAVRLGGETVTPGSVEAGTGFYEKRYAPPDITAAMGAIEIEKSDPGIAWGGVHWEYMEDISRITPHTQNPLRLEKRLFVRRFTAKGPEIRPVEGPLEVGDLLRVRIVLRTDRDMEYVHLRDHRGSGMEPENVLSRYKYQDGLVYYESTRDTATDFFIDYLPKGTYVFEYPLRLVHAGTYHTGMAHIECMYAPEFNSHSQSIEVKVAAR